MRNAQNGFTLVEIALVLIVIGLMIGGVMKGQELIDNAKVKNLMGDFRNIPIYLYAYQDKFRSLPGDDAGVDSHLGNELCSAGCKATTPDQLQGNGMIDGAWNSTVRSDESFRFWQHIRLAGLMAGPTDVSDVDYLPRNALGGRIGITNGSAPPIATLRGTHVVCSRGIPGKFAKQIDIALDDGNTATGAIQAMANSASASDRAIPSSGSRGINNETPYTLCMGF